jgi:phosphoglucomutase
VTNLESNEQTELSLPSSNVLGFSFASGNKLFLRPSGTEPKIKFYIMIQQNEGSLETKKSQALKITEDFLGFIKAKAESI